MEVWAYDYVLCGGEDSCGPKLVVMHPSLTFPPYRIRGLPPLPVQPTPNPRLAPAHSLRLAQVRACLRRGGSAPGGSAQMERPTPALGYMHTRWTACRASPGSLPFPLCRHPFPTWDFSSAPERTPAAFAITADGSSGHAVRMWAARAWRVGPRSLCKKALSWLIGVEWNEHV